MNPSLLEQSMNIFGKKKKKEEIPFPVKERVPTGRLERTVVLDQTKDPEFAVIREITYMESEEVII